MRTILFLFACLTFLTCSEPSHKKESPIPIPPPIDINLVLDSLDILTQPDSMEYAITKSNIRQLRNSLNQTEISKDSLSKIFTHSLVNQIIPYWYGTPWSFEGHTSKPNQGEIACGYFVSTTLLHMGMNLNRYRLAQQAPIYEAKTLAIDSSLIEIYSYDVQNNIDSINVLIPEGIHFIGYDQSHVGYILKQKNYIFLIHSNYSGGKGVDIELIDQSEVFKTYNQFYIAEISTNEKLMDAWLNQKEIKVLKQ